MVSNFTVGFDAFAIGIHLFPFSHTCEAALEAGLTHLPKMKVKAKAPNTVPKAVLPPPKLSQSQPQPIKPTLLPLTQPNFQSQPPLQGANNIPKVPSVDFNLLENAEASYVKDLESQHTSQAHNSLAVYYASKGDFARAVMESKKAILLDPTNELAHTNLVHFSNCLQK